MKKCYIFAPELITIKSLKMKYFKNYFIGIKDSNGVELINGDKIIIEIVKPSALSRAGVYHEGNIVYENGAFCIDTGKNVNALFNYAKGCKITKK